jgi:hypothetical protein
MHVFMTNLQKYNIATVFDSMFAAFSLYSSIIDKLIMFIIEFENMCTKNTYIMGLERCPTIGITTIAVFDKGY